MRSGHQDFAARIEALDLESSYSYVIIYTDFKSMFENIDTASLRKRFEALHKIAHCPTIIDFFVEIVQFAVERQYFVEPDFNLDTRGTIYSREHGLLIGTNFAKELAELYYLADEVKLVELCKFYTRQVGCC